MEPQKKIKQNTPSLATSKFIVICGGCVSGLGKGITTSSMGYLLKQAGRKVTVVKIDPYLNIDAGTMNPYEHGECFVTDDGGEVDLDLGNYERYLDIRLSAANNITTGKVFEQIHAKGEKNKTLSMLPDLSNTVIEMIQQQAVGFDVTLIEVGGTVGDIESRVFYESVRSLIYQLGRHSVCLVLVTYVPILGQSGEQKTKPTQQAVTQLRTYGLQPDLIVCRSDQPLEPANLRKISIYSGVQKQCIFNNQDVTTTLGVPLVLQDQNMLAILQRHLALPSSRPDLLELQQYLIYQFQLINSPKTVRIAVVGKYTGMRDTYMSVIKALQHSGVEAGVNLKIQMVEAEHLLQEHPDQEINWRVVQESDGVLVPGGFGQRGNEGILQAIEYVRTKDKKPFLGICFGFQLATIEHSRNVLGQSTFTSQEFDPEGKIKENHYVISQMSHLDPKKLGGTMRKGLKSTLILNQDTLAYKIYGRLKIEERHRHRYEVNPVHTHFLQQKGFSFSGIAEEDTRRNIILERTQSGPQGHPFFFATQYHPELLSRQFTPSPPVLAFVLASAGLLEERLKESSKGVLTQLHPWRNITIEPPLDQLHNYVHKYIRVVNNTPISSKSFDL